MGQNFFLRIYMFRAAKELKCIPINKNKKETHFMQISQSDIINFYDEGGVNTKVSNKLTDANIYVKVINKNNAFKYSVLLSLV